MYMFITNKDKLALITSSITVASIQNVLKLLKDWKNLESFVRVAERFYSPVPVQG